MISQTILSIQLIVLRATTLRNKLFYPFFHHNKYSNKCYTSISIPKILYVKIMEQWIQPNYVALKKIIHLPVHNNYMHELKSTSTTVLQRGIQVHAARPCHYYYNSNTIRTIRSSFFYGFSCYLHNNASYLNVTTTS